MSESRAALRALIRALNSNVTNINGNRSWTRHAVEQFRSQRDATGEALQQQIQLAKDYTFLIQSVHHHKDLLMSYNIGIHIDDREKNMNKRAAQLVGLAMPSKPDE